MEEAVWCAACLVPGSRPGFILGLRCLAYPPLEFLHVAERGWEGVGGD